MEQGREAVFPWIDEQKKIIASLEGPEQNEPQPQVLEILKQDLERISGETGSFSLEALKHPVQ